MKPANEGTVVYMKNSTTISVQGVGEVELKFTFGNVVTLTNVLYVPEVRKNLVSRGLLNKFGFRLVFETNEFVLSKGGIYVGKDYLCNGMFKLNVLVITNNKNNVIPAYLVESFSSLWHNKLNHVNYKRMHEMMRLDILP